MKKVIRKEKKKNRKNKLQKIKEQGGPSCKLFWSTLAREKEKPEDHKDEREGRSSS